MADRYWVGGTGTWNTTSTTNWRTTSGGTTVAAVPTVSDNVIFDGNSGGAFTVTMTGALNCASITVATGDTVTFATGTTPTLNVRGSMYLSGSTLWNSTGTVTFSATTAVDINNNGVVMDCPIIFNGVGGSWTLQSSFAYGKTAIRAMTLTNGTINGYGTTVSSLFASTLTIQTNTNSLIDFVTTCTGLTTLASGTLNLTGGSFAGAFTHTNGTLNVNYSGVTSDPVVTGAYTFTAGALNFNTSLTTGSFTWNGGTITLNSYTLNCNTWASTGTTARTFAFGTGNLTVRGSGVGLFSMASATNVTTTGSKSVYITNATGTASTVAPGALSEAASLDFYFYGAYTLTFLGTATHAARNVNFYDFGGTWAANSTGTIYGNLKLATGMTLTTSASELTFGATSGTQTITSNGKTIDFPITVNGNNATTVTCADALTLGSTQALTFALGTLQLKSSATSTVGSFVTSGTTLKYLQSTTSGTQATISDASGTNTVTYLSIQDSAATGGATFDASAATNVNAGNNTGWTFVSAASNGNFFFMF